ncbi:MAG: DUF86 domain-containing protein [Deltaproteobacteria bacterium]|nr:DUF86 domain-containing protein [Deltaproteobacteria bacterium]
MTNPDLLAKKLARVETCLRELRQHGHPDALDRDVIARRFVEHTLQIAIQAAMDAAAHVVSDERLREPSTNAQLFTLLRDAGCIDAALSGRLRQMVGFRNVLVHGYDEVDLDIVRDVLTHRLPDLEAFVEAIRRRTAT